MRAPFIFSEKHRTITNKFQMHKPKTYRKMFIVTFVIWFSLTDCAAFMPVTNKRFTTGQQCILQNIYSVCSNCSFGDLFTHTLPLHFVFKGVVKTNCAFDWLKILVCTRNNNAIVLLTLLCEHFLYIEESERDSGYSTSIFWWYFHEVFISCFYDWHRPG